MMRYVAVLFALAFGVSACSHFENALPQALGHAGVAAQNKRNFNVIFVFNGTDGSGPGTLIASHGILYGTTFGGGAHNRGILFSLTSNGRENVIYRFDKSGVWPQGSVTTVNGVLYGTTAGGGTRRRGTVFAIKTDGTELWTYLFKGGFDGEGPAAGLIALNGLLYGTTSFGGNRYANAGAVFKVTRSGKESVLYAFRNAPDGADPRASLVALNGVLYGTTYGGGMSNGSCGTVFSVKKSGAEKVLHAFDCSDSYSDGNSPVAGLAVLNGALFGTTFRGGQYGEGTVFSISTGGQERVIHSFGAKGDGYSPQGPLLAYNGKLYGTTPYGGEHNLGTIFEMTATGKERLLHSFDGSDGSAPFTGLVALNATLYGTTASGPSSGRDGEAFALKP